jgi:hypothetical protein
VLPLRADLINVFEVFLPQLLLYPNPTDPLNGEAAALLMREPAKYNSRVQGACDAPASGGRGGGAAGSSCICLARCGVRALQLSCSWASLRLDGGGASSRTHPFKQLHASLRHSTRRARMAGLTQHACSCTRALRCAAAEYVRRYANPSKSSPSSKASEDGSDKMEQDGQQRQDGEGGHDGDDDDSDGGFLSSSEEEMDG